MRSTSFRFLRTAAALLAAMLLAPALSAGNDDPPTPTLAVELKEAKAPAAQTMLPVVPQAVAVPPADEVMDDVRAKLNCGPLYCCQYFEQSYRKGVPQRTLGAHCRIICVAVKKDCCPCPEGCFDKCAGRCAEALCCGAAGCAGLACCALSGSGSGAAAGGGGGGDCCGSCVAACGNGCGSLGSCCASGCGAAGECLKCGCEHLGNGLCCVLSGLGNGLCECCGACCECMASCR